MMYKRKEKKILIYILSFLIPVIMMLIAVIFLRLFFNLYLSAKVLLIIALQTGFSGLTFQLYLNHTNKFNKEALLFSTAYAIMGCLFADIALSVYFCNIILLPLVMLGISKLIENPKKKTLYILCLTASILCNFYFGYMLCLFSLFYFFYILIVKTDRRKYTKEPIEKIKAFFIASLIGIGLSAFDLIPNTFFPDGQKNVSENAASAIYQSALSHETPYIYIGIIVIIFVILYFFNNEISGKERICSGIFLVIILLSCYIHMISIFLISFILLHLGYQGFLKYQGRLISYLPVVLIFFICFFYIVTFSNINIEKEMVLFNAVLILLVGILIFFKSNYYMPLEMGFVLLFSLQCADLVFMRLCR